MNAAGRERFSSMPSDPQRETSSERYTFRFDAPIPRHLFGDRYDLSGWLVDTTGAPITGIRALVRRPFMRKKIFSARRKRSRPDIAAGFPHLPEAKTSGFLLELSLGWGPNHITLQVRDEQRVWRTFHRTSMIAHPLRLLKAIGFRESRQFVLSKLQRRVADKTRIHVAPTDTHRPALASRYKRIDLFATSRSNLFILEIGELVAAGFRELGCQSRLLLDEPPAREPRADTLQIVVTPHEYYNLFLTTHVSKDEATALTKKVVLLCTEQPDTGWFYNNLPWAYEAMAVADINALGARAYKGQGIPSYHFRLGYHDILATNKSIPHSERSFDITFLGAFTPRRERFFARHAPFFAGQRCHLRFVPLGFAKTNVTRSYLGSDRRNELLSQSRLLLNLHYADRKYFEWHRALVALANGSCFISETAEGYGDLIPGRHFAMADGDDLIGCCHYLLTYPDEAERIAEQGCNYIKQHLRQSQACQQFLNALEAGTNEIAEGDVRPEPLPGRLRRELRRERVRSLKKAIAADFTRRNVDTTELIVEREIPTIPKEEIIDRRRAFQKRLAEQEAERQNDGQAWQLHSNDAYRQRDQPALTILVTLFNYAHHINECLRSIEAAAVQITDVLEIVIVNDASTDDSLAQVLHYQKTTTLPMRIVNKRYNTGLADARNIGALLSRAPYVFMMDADNLVFPGALAQLLAAIRHEDADAAFSMLCRFKGTTKDRVGLLSYYDWDPEILVQQPYIDAMAMFRREILLKLSYDTNLSQIGWFGWEDYELWLRFAQNNYKVAFVPNILCLYRHHETSMINLTNLFEAELVEHFLKRFDDLAGKFEPREMLFGVPREKMAGK